MRPLLFGECLGRLVRLSGHDVAEILEDQTNSRRRFGEIALAWDLCRPQHVWHAWCQQLSQNPQRVDLSSIGVDTQALAHVSRDLALRYHVLPLRTLGEQLVLATSEEHFTKAASDLPPRLKKKLRFVLADPQQLRTALSCYYATAVAHAGAD